MNKKLNLIELNEINFDLVRNYVNQKPIAFPGFRRLFEMNKFKTFGETKYENIEPWVHWVSVHTERDFDQHQVFRLGDIVEFDGEQIFEKLERCGVRVGCVSPMNVDNRLARPAFFIPDPWTRTSTDGSLLSRWIHRALRQAVNDNAQEKIQPKTLVFLLLAFLRFSKAKNWLCYIKLFVRRKKRWNKALFLDLFLSDTFIALTQKHNNDFSTLFLNGFAHIQHHYFLSSKYYDGSLINPGEYIKKEDDPILDAIKIYDRIINQILGEVNGQKIIATALQQVAVKEHTIYYRLRSHDEFLRKIGLSNFKVEPRMTRDFKLTFSNQKSADDGIKLLRSLKHNGIRIFENVDVRDGSVFITLTYSQMLHPNDVLKVNSQVINLQESFVFVALKNGYHDTNGYGFLDFSPKILRCGDQNQHVKYIGKEVINYFVE